MVSQYISPSSQDVSSHHRSKHMHNLQHLWLTLVGHLHGRGVTVSWHELVKTLVSQKISSQLSASVDLPNHEVKVVFGSTVCTNL